MYEQEIHEKIKKIEQEIKETPYHKGTERHIGRLKAKLAKLRERLNQKGSGGGGGGGFGVSKQGDATVVLVGLPSVGKSTLLNKITGADSKTGHYPFTTLNVIPGVLKWKGANIQIFDVPGLIEGAARGKGGGRQILSVVRVADLLIFIASPSKLNSFKTMEKELSRAGVRMNQKPPEVEIKKKGRGGIEIQGDPGLSEDLVCELAREFRILNAEIRFGEKITEDQFIDVLAGNRVYVPSFRVVSKIDLANKKRRKEIKKEWPEALEISAKEEINLEKLKDKIFEELSLMRVYLKEEAGEKKPLICKEGDTVKNAAEKISTELAEKIEGGRIKGPSALFPNQKVGKSHRLKDGDRIYFTK